MSQCFPLDLDSAMDEMNLESGQPACRSGDRPLTSIPEDVAVYVEPHLCVRSESSVESSEHAQQKTHDAVNTDGTVQQLANVEDASCLDSPLLEEHKFSGNQPCVTLENFEGMTQSQRLAGSSDRAVGLELPPAGMVNGNRSNLREANPTLLSPVGRRKRPTRLFALADMSDVKHALSAAAMAASLTTTSCTT